MKVNKILDMLWIFQVLSKLFAMSFRMLGSMYCTAVHREWHIFGSKVVVSLETIGETVFEIQISDDGPGIPKELQAKVFEPFYKGDDARSFIGRGGFGLGLSIVRDVVSRHGGTISFSDNDPSGLVVRLSFDRSPATTDPVRTASRIDPAHQLSPGEGIRSLSR
jgi:nitrogen fixation/metabolism regulation signal transduction histidine kinase